MCFFSPVYQFTFFRNTEKAAGPWHLGHLQTSFPIHTVLVSYCRESINFSNYSCTEVSNLQPAHRAVLHSLYYVQNTSLNWIWPNVLGECVEFRKFPTVLSWWWITNRRNILTWEYLRAWAERGGAQSFLQDFIFPSELSGAKVTFAVRFF